MDADWKILFEHLSTEGNGISVCYQGIMTKRRLDILLETLALTSNAMFSDGATSERAKQPPAEPE